MLEGNSSVFIRARKAEHHRTIFFLVHVQTKRKPRSSFHGITLQSAHPYSTPYASAHFTPDTHRHMSMHTHVNIFFNFENFIVFLLPFSSLFKGVSGIVGRAEILACTFFSLSFLSYHKYVKNLFIVLSVVFLLPCIYAAGKMKALLGQFAS